MSTPTKENNNMPKLDDFIKIEVKLTDVELQFVVSNEQRKNQTLQNTMLMFAEIMQHFLALTAKKKNIQFNQARFAGAYYDAEKGKAFILQHKTEQKPDDKK